MNSKSSDFLIAPVAWCLLSALLFGASTPASKLLLESEMQPLTLAGLLYFGAGIASLPWALRAGSSKKTRTPSNQRKLLGAVFFGGFVGPIALLFGLQSVPAGSASLLLNLETTATALIAWMYFKESIGTRGWIANFGVLIAGMLLVAPQGFELAPAASLIVIACVCWGLDNNLTAVIDGYTPAQVTVWKGFVAGGTSIGLGFAFESQHYETWALLTALGVGALAYGASTILYVKGAQQLGATRSQMLFSTAPFFGLGASWVVFGEPILTVQLFAAALMGLAVAGLLYSGHTHRHHHHSITHTHSHRHDDGHHPHAHDSQVDPQAWHSHEHSHDDIEHEHEHMPDLHHRHEH